jgi:hypothetical protein
LVINILKKLHSYNHYNEETSENSYGQLKQAQSCDHKKGDVAITNITQTRFQQDSAFKNQAISNKNRWIHL